MRWCTTIDEYEVWNLACIARCSWAACAFNIGSPRHALIHVISHIFSTCTYFRTETQDLSGSKIATNLGLLFPKHGQIQCIALCFTGLYNVHTLNTCVQLNLVIGFTACYYVCKYTSCTLRTLCTLHRVLEGHLLTSALCIVPDLCKQGCPTLNTVVSCDWSCRCVHYVHCAHCVLCRV